MSTPCAIAITRGSSYEWIYCHFDGYVAGVGVTLKKSYRNQKKVEQLIDLGDISSIGEVIGEKQDPKNRHKGWTLAYGRDLGRADSGSRKSSNLEKLIYDAEKERCRYLYVFENNKWQYVDIIEGDKTLQIFATKKKGVEYEYGSSKE